MNGVAYTNPNQNSITIHNSKTIPSLETKWAKQGYPANTQGAKWNPLIKHTATTDGKQSPKESQPKLGYSTSQTLFAKATIANAYHTPQALCACMNHSKNDYHYHWLWLPGWASECPMKRIRATFKGFLVRLHWKIIVGWLILGSERLIQGVVRELSID